jgi:hypothetical protein
MSRARDWLRRQPAESWLTGLLVLGSALFIFSQMQPSLLFKDTTPAGGDMGAHVWGPAFLREELLPRFRLSGWAPDWYDGFPAYQFYMVLPSLAIVFLDVVLFLPYNVAFKLVAVSGLVLLPVAAWGMGRLARLPFPMPAALAVATVPFVFDRSFSIYGGNAASTLAGEFAFTISLCFALLFLGTVLRGLETGRSRAAAATLLALTVLNHLIPAVFALIGAAAALLVATDWRARRFHLLAGRAEGPRAWLQTVKKDPNLLGHRLRIWWLLSVVAVGSLISSFWVVPFYLRRSYVNDMGWEKLTNYFELLFPGRIGELLPGTEGDVPGDLTWVIVLALVGVGAAIWMRRRFGIWVAVTALVLAIGVVVTPQGRLWNARLLPFWYLCLYFLAALAVVEIVAALAVVLRRGGEDDEAERPNRAVLVAGPLVAALLVLIVVGMPLRALPLGSTSADGLRYSWLGLSTTDQSYIPIWAKWNFSGYEEKEAYPEYQDVVSAMRKVGEERGCGRAMWEYDSELDRFGTPMALMLLPYWTEGCIGSMEGLYFEASATTPYHFINQSELSAEPSRAQRDLPYGNLDIELGVDHLQLLGVKYYMAFSDAAVAQADEEPDLSLVASTGAWRVYEVAHSELVQPLANEPAVVRGIDEGHKGWQEMAVNWYLDRSRWPVMLAADGPSPWQRVREGEQPAERDYSGTTISELEVDADTIKFQVDRPGAPILVKASYFPNWDASGAEGPYRVAPNLMVVVPTDNFVELNFKRTSVDWAGIAMTLVGIWLAVLLARRRRLRIPPRTPKASPDDVPTPPWSDDVLATVGGGGPERERWSSPPPEEGTAES